MNYYNEIDPGAAAWLRELIDRGEIPRGIVDTRSIVDVRPSDLRGFTQCHFFAGIGGWPLALRLAGVPSTTRCWTGSPPCQPFSLAGKQIGFEDPRHLAPAFLDLIAESNPPVLFGEQVRNAIGKHWLDFIFMDMEAEGYICGSAVLPAGGAGAPHQRDRIVFGAVADGRSEGSQRRLRGWADAQREILDRYTRCGGAAGILPCTLAAYPTPLTVPDSPKSRGQLSGSFRRLMEPCLPDLDTPVRITSSGQMLTGSDAGMGISGPLNPALSRWVMGFPPVWDDCAVTAMPSSRKSARTSSVPLSVLLLRLSEAIFNNRVAREHHHGQ